MAKITNIQELREHALDALDQLRNGMIDKKELGIIAKVCEGIQSGIHLEIEYCKAIGKEPNIAFMGNCTGEFTIETIRNKQNLIEHS